MTKGYYLCSYGSETGSGLAWWFWLTFSEEAKIKVSTRMQVHKGQFGEVQIHSCRPLHRASSWFPLREREGRERERERERRRERRRESLWQKPQSFCHIILEMTFYHFCRVLFNRRESTVQPTLSERGLPRGQGAENIRPP